MMGISIKKALYVYVDNMFVITNDNKPQVMLKMKLNMSCCHYTAIGEALIAHIPTRKKLADLITKVLHGETLLFLVDRMPWDVFPRK